MSIHPGLAEAQSELPAGVSGRFLVDRWTTANGLPQNSINDIIQTRDGYIWIATFGGLTRFDGVKFTVFNQTNSQLPTNRITALFEDRDGVMWVGSQDFGIASGIGGVFRAYGPDGGVGSTTVWDIAQTRDGDLWFGTASGLIRYDGDRFERFDAQPGLPPGGIASLLAASDGSLWVGTLNGLVHRADDGFTIHREESGLPDRRVRAVFEDAMGRLWVMTESGLSQRRADRFVFVEQRRPLASATAGVMAGAPGGVLLGGWNLAEVDSAGTVEVLAIEGLSAQSPGATLDFPIHALLTDRERNRWIGTRGGGLLKLRDPPFLRYLHDGDVAAIAVDADGLVWAGGCSSGLRFFRDGVFTSSTLPLDREWRCVQDVYLDRDGALWVSHGAGFSVRRSPEITRHEPGHVPVMFHQDGQGRVWTNGVTGLARIDESGVMRTAPGTETLRVRYIAESRDGALWLGLLDGLARVADDTVTTYSTADGLSPGQVRAVYEDQDGVLWIGTYGGGLSRLVDDRFTRYTTADGLRDDVISQILEDDRGQLWLSGNMGVSYVGRDELNAFARGEVRSITPVHFGPGDGVPEGNAGRALEAPDGRMWFPTIDGVVVVDPATRRRNAVPPPVRIERVTLDDRETEHRNGLRILTGTARVEIDYTALSFLRPAEVRFRYRLDRYDADWVDAGASRTAVYTSLPPGGYEFRVIARNDEDVWNLAGATLAVAVVPPIYATWWFRTVAVLAAASAGFWVFALRTRAIRERARALQTQIDQREAAEAQREQLETQLRQAQKLESVGQITGGVAHDFNNLLTVIMGNLELLIEGLDPNSKDRETLGHAMSAAERAASLTHRLLAFSRKQALRPQVMDLRTLVTGMEDLLRRTLGEAIQIETVGGGGLWKCEVDPVQFESVILNLAINARDAMPAGGLLTIETGNARLDESYAAHHPGARPGQYVLLAVADTGRGMPPEVVDMAFDPFFTTKDVGRGSGLGLSMVYGFVKQSNGHVKIYSEVGQGTTVKVYLPRATGEADELPVQAVDEEPHGNGELILVVEDDASVRELTVTRLHRLGYTTLEAADGPAALKLLHKAAEVRLLFTDVVLPGGMTGPQVARAWQRYNPDVPVLYASGYSDDAIIHHGRLDRGVTLLEKPFSKSELARKVFAMLNG